MTTADAVPETASNGSPSAPHGPRADPGATQAGHGATSKPPAPSRPPSPSVPRPNSAGFLNERKVERLWSEGMSGKQIAKTLSLSTKQVGRYLRRIRQRWAAVDADPAEYLHHTMVRLREDSRKARDEKLVSVAMRGEVAAVAVLRQLHDLRAQAAEAKAAAAHRAQLAAGSPGIDRQAHFEQMTPEQLAEEIASQEGSILAMANGTPGEYGVGFAAACRRFAADWAALAERHDCGDVVPRLPPADSSAEVEAEAVPEPVAPPAVEPDPEPAPIPKAPGRGHCAPSRGYVEGGPRLVAERTTTERVYIDARDDGEYDSPGQARAYRRARGR